MDWGKRDREKLMKQRGTASVAGADKGKLARQADAILKAGKRKKKRKARKRPWRHTSQSKSEYLKTQAECRAYDGPPPWEE